MAFIHNPRINVPPCNITQSRPVQHFFYNRTNHLPAFACTKQYDVALRSSALMVYPPWISFISSARTHGRRGGAFPSSLPANYRNSQLLVVRCDDASSCCYNATVLQRANGYLTRPKTTLVGRTDINQFTLKTLTLQAVKNILFILHKPHSNRTFEISLEGKTDTARYRCQSVSF